MEIDTRASTTVVNEKTFHNLAQWESALKLNVVNTVLCTTYTGEFVTVVGECRLAVEYSGFKGSSSAVVISGEGSCLMGRNWLQHISLNWSEIFHLATMYTDLRAAFRKYRLTVGSSSKFDFAHFWLIDNP